MTSKINWEELLTERMMPVITYKQKKLFNGVFACPHCRGSGSVIIVFSSVCPNRTGTCYMCDGTGEIIKCIHPDCIEPVPNEPNWYANKLCAKHEREHIDKLVKNDKR